MSTEARLFISLAVASAIVYLSTPVAIRIADRLHTAADSIRERAGGGSRKRSKAAKKAARTRKAKKASRRHSARKGAKSRR